MRRYALYRVPVLVLCVFLCIRYFPGQKVYEPSLKHIFIRKWKITTFVESVTKWSSLWKCEYDRWRTPSCTDSSQCSFGEKCVWRGGFFFTQLAPKPEWEGHILAQVCTRLIRGFIFALLICFLWTRCISPTPPVLMDAFLISYTPVICVTVAVVSAGEMY